MKRIAGIILAAGAASRMGQAKQLLPFQGQSLLQRCVQLAQGSGLDPVIVVTGAHKEAIRRAHPSLLVQWEHNDNWASGMGSSLHKGLEALSSDIEGALILLADQPRITSDHLAGLIQAFHARNLPIISTHYPHGPGVPALFRRDLFGDLLSLPPKVGARKFLQSRDDVSVQLSIPAPGQYLDIDTPEDYHNLLNQTSDKEG